MKLSARLEDALRFAWQTHSDQRRKGSNIPYVSHLLAVASIVMEHGGDEDAVIGALLHDCIEDRGVELEELRRRFGGRVAEIVRGCTDSFEKDPTRKAPWLERKQAYLAHLPVAPPAVQLVSAADKLHNARAILRDYRELGDGVWKRFKTGSRDDILWYYRSLVKAFLAGGQNKTLVDELDRIVTELAELAARRSAGN